MSKFSRRSFLKTAGAAAGAAMIGASPAAAGAIAEASPELVPRPSRLPKEPLVAIVRDAGRGEVSVVSGTEEWTYRDPALVKRLLKAAKRQHGRGGGVA